MWFHWLSERKMLARFAQTLLVLYNSLVLFSLFVAAADTTHGAAAKTRSE